MADFVERLERELVAAVQEMGEAIYRESQRNVPVVSGQLKKSGYVKKLPNGVEIGYTAPYAPTIEYGIPTASPLVAGQSRPQDVSSSSIFLTRPVHSVAPPTSSRRLKPRYFLSKAVDRRLSKWGQMVGSHLQRVFGK